MKQKSKAGSFNIFPYANYLIIVVPVLVFISTLSLGYVYFDDDLLILSNFEKLTNPANILLAFRTDAFFANLSPYYRPLMNVSFMIDAIIGGKSPVIYHFSNLLYHVLSCLALYKLLILLGVERNKSLIGTLIFSIHPVMGHAVMWIPARGDILVTLFAILALINLINYYDRKSYKYLILHLICLTLAVFSKESGVLLPIIFVIIMLIKKENLFTKDKWLAYLFWVVILGFWYFMRYITIDHRPDEQRGLEPVIKNLPFLPEAIARLLVPFNLPVTPIFTTGILLVGLFGIVVLLFLSYRNWNAANKSLIFLGLAWFLGFCLPNMYVRLISAGDSFEYLLHRLYLPGIGFLIFLLGILPENWFRLDKRLYQICFSALIISFISYNFYQQSKYKNGINFWSSAIKYAPERSWFHYHMGRYYFMLKDFDNYEKYLLTADSIRSYPIFRYNLAMIYYTERKDYDKAYEYFRTTFKQGFSDTEAAENFILFCIESSYDYFKRQEYDKAISRCQIALNNAPNNGVAAYNMGIYLVTIGKKEEAQSMWRRAITNHPELKEAYKSLSLYYQYDVKKPDSATYFADQYQKHGGIGNIIINR